MKYNLNDNIILRTPILDFEAFNQEITSIKESNVNMNNIFKEGLALTNFSLYKNYIENVGDGKKINDSIKRYFNRACVRSTPYGLFSGIGNCKFGKKTSILRDENTNFTKICNVDLEWYYSIIRLLEKNISVLYNLDLRFNARCYVRGERLLNPDLQRKPQNDIKNNDRICGCSVNYTKPVKMICDYSNKWISFSELKFKIKEVYENIPDYKIENTILSLLNNGYLISNLISPLSYKNPLGYTIDKLTTFVLDDEAKSILCKLKKIETCMNDYDELTIGTGITKLKYLLKEMEDLYKSKDYLNGITQIKLNNNEFGNNIKQEINDFINFLVTFSTQDNENNIIYCYKKNFREKYGDYVDVPILEVIDPIKGIGNPYNDMNIIETLPISEKKEKIHKLFFDKILECVFLGKNSIEILDADLEYVSGFDKEQIIPFCNTFDLAFSIRAKSIEEINCNKFELVIAPCVGGNRGGALVNRFYCVLDKNSRESLEKLYKHDIDLSDWIIADTSCVVANGRINNVSAGHKNYHFSISYGLPCEGKEIDFSDLYVGYDSLTNRLYIKSKSMNKKVCVVSDSMLNPAATIPIIRFMREVSHGYEIHPLETIMYIQNLCTQFKYTPEIKFGKVIVQKETWRFYKEDFLDIDNYYKFKEDFEKLVYKWRIPKIININDTDKYLCINLQNEKDWDIFYHEAKKALKKGLCVELSEAENEKSGWLQDINGKKYLSEMVVHCEKDNNKKNMNVETEQSVFRDSMTDDNKKHRRDNYVDIYNNSKRICIPGGDGWIYFKVYVAHKSQNAFLSFYIPLLLSELENVDDNAYCFFIRYADPQQHIRIRIHSSNRNTMQILKVANRIFDNARKKGDIAGYSINCYEREIERYGGSKLIELAEKIFASDSNLVIELLKLFYTEDVLDEDTDLIFASLIYDMLIHFWDSSEDVEKHMNMYIQKNEFRKEFKKIKKRFEEVINNIENIIDNRCRKSLENRNLCIKDYRKRMNELELRKELANTKEDIVMSFIHMFCNRVNGDRAWERKMLAYVSHMVHIVNERSKCYKNSIS